MTFTLCVAVINPASTAQKRTERYLAQLKESYPDLPIQVIETSPANRQETINYLHARFPPLDKHVLICIGGGDGTVGAVVEALLTSPDNTSSEAAILPLWGGNANDLAYALNGPPEKASIGTILEKGRIKALYPLLCHVDQNQQQTASYIATSYISFGATAFAAHRLNEPEHRQRLKDTPPMLRFMREAVSAGQALNDSAPFTITQNNTDIPAYDYLFTKGSRVAKVFPAPSHPHQPVYHSKLLRYKNPLYLLRHFLELAWPGAARGNITHDTILTLHQDTWAQFDGETTQLPAGATVHISISKKPFHGVSTLLK